MCPLPFALMQPIAGDYILENRGGTPRSGTMTPTRHAPEPHVAALLITTTRAALLLGRFVVRFYDYFAVLRGITYGEWQWFYRRVPRLWFCLPQLRSLDPNHGSGSKHPSVACLFLAVPAICSYKNTTVERQNPPTLPGNLREHRRFRRRHYRSPHFS